MSEDLISREQAYEVLTEYYHHKTEMQHKALREALDRVPPANLQPTCNKLATNLQPIATDCISRQAAIDVMCRALHYNYEEGYAVTKMLELPSADVPERNVGKWLEREVIHADEAKEIITEWQSCKCSVCGCYDTRPYLYCFNEPSFCSWCGAKMEGVSDE